MLTDNPNAALILVVEDDGGHIELIQRSFAAASDEYRLEITGTISDAKSAMLRQAPDIVLTDDRLPDGSGTELVVMAAGLWPIIMMTSSGNEQTAVETIKTGAQDYILKSPEAFHDLPRTVTYALKLWALNVARRQADEALLRANKDWERTFNTVPDLISIIDLNHSITRANRAMADRCGLSPEELVGRKCCEIVHGMQEPSAGCPVAGMVLDGQGHKVEIEEKRLNGIFDVTVSPLVDEEGRITAYVHVMRDISEYKKTEELVRQRLKLRDIASTSSVVGLMQATLDACELLTDSSIGFFHMVDEDQQNLTLQAWSSNTLATMCTAEGQIGHNPISTAGVWAECFNRREPVIHNDYATLPDKKGMPSAHVPVLRLLTIPFILNDKVVSIIGIGNKRFPYTDHDVYIIRQFVTFASEVIERKRSNVALKESEERHRKLAIEQRIILDTSSVGICFLKNRKVLWTNPAFDLIFGYEAGTFHTMDTEKLYAHRETYDFIGEEAYAIIKSGGIFSQDVMMKKKDGSLIWCNLVGQAVTPGSAEDGSIWIMMDITERKQMTRLLAENEVRLRTIIQTIPDLIWLKDVDGVYLLCNRMFERFFGTRESDIVGKTDYDFLDRKLADSFREHDRKAMAAGEPCRNEEWVTFADNGQRVLLDTLKTPMFTSEGLLIGVLGISRDITESKRAQEERELMIDVYRLLNKTNDLSETIHDVTLLLKSWTGIEAIGIRLQSGHDFTYYETIGFPPEFVEKENFLCTRDSSGNVLLDNTGNPVLECMCGNILCGHFDPDLPFFTKSGSFWSNGTTALLATTTEADRQARTRNRCNGEGYESVALIPMRHAGHVFGLLQFNDHRPDCFSPAQIELFERVANTLAVALAQKQAEEERWKLEQQFHQTQKLESLGVLAGVIAHDFNNILTIILGHCYMVGENVYSGLTDKDHVKQIEAAGNRAAELCRQMLNYAGKGPQIQTKVNPWLLIDEVVKMLQSAIKKHVVIELDLKRDVPELIGDSSQIQQIVMNLIINAAEAIGDNNGTVAVVLKKAVIQEDQSVTDVNGNAIPARNYACLEVSDTGCGIDDEIKKRIFEPFFTTKFTGRGLGMSSVLGIVKAHDGALHMTSVPGVGTTFTVYFPLPAVPDSVQIAPTATPLPQVKGNGTILLVDDEESLRTIGSALLRAMGFSAMTAANGREALEIYHEQENAIDLILLDMIMPVMGGLETYRRLREISSTIPIVMISGYILEDLLTEIDRDEHFLVLEKPYKPDQLRNTLMTLLG